MHIYIAISFQEKHSFVTFQMELKHFFLVLFISCAANCIDYDGVKEEGNASESLKYSDMNLV